MPDHSQQVNELISRLKNFSDLEKEYLRVADKQWERGLDSIEELQYYRALHALIEAQRALR